MPLLYFCELSGNTKVLVGPEGSSRRTSLKLIDVRTMLRLWGSHSLQEGAVYSCVHANRRGLARRSLHGLVSSLSICGRTYGQASEVSLSRTIAVKEAGRDGVKGRRWYSIKEIERLRDEKLKAEQKLYRGEKPKTGLHEEGDNILLNAPAIIVVNKGIGPSTVKSYEHLVKVSALVDGSS